MTTPVPAKIEKQVRKRFPAKMETHEGQVEAHEGQMETYHSFASIEAPSTDSRKRWAHWKDKAARDAAEKMEE